MAQVVLCHLAFDNLGSQQVPLRFNVLAQTLPVQKVADAMAGKFDVNRLRNVIGSSQRQAENLVFRTGQCG